MEVPKSTMVYSFLRKIMNPCWVCSSIPPWQKIIDSGNRVEEWGPFLAAWRMVARDHSRPISAGKALAV